MLVVATLNSCFLYKIRNVILREWELRAFTFTNLSKMNGLASITQKFAFLNLSGSIDKVFFRNTSYFNKLPAADLWQGVTSVSNAGKKRGRGKGSGKKVAKDLNRGQVIGVGRSMIRWPGLNAPVIRGKDLIKQEKLPEDPAREANVIKLRDSMGTFRLTKLSPIDRGWSGGTMAGRSIGAPDPVGEDSFEEFDTRVLENKIVFIMKGNVGRRRRYSVLTVTGNGKGLAGFSTAKALDAKTALRKSKNRAVQKLMHFNLCEDRTVMHDFHCGFGKTKIFVTKPPEGTGLVCHRAIATICKTIGIKDLHAKIEGSTNLQHIVKAFFIGLLQQKSYESLAHEKGLHLIEFLKQRDAFPLVKAKSTNCSKTDDDRKSDESVDFSQFILNGRIVLRKKTFAPFYAKTNGYALFLKKKEIFRNQDEVRLDMLIEKEQAQENPISN